MMKYKILYTGTILALILFSSVAIAMKLPPTWQFAYKDNGTVFYFDTNTLHTIETTHIDDDPPDDDDTATNNNTALTTANTTTTIAAASTNTIDTTSDEDNVIGVKMKTVLSSTLLDELIDTYKDQYDTTTWYKINYFISYNIYNRTDKTLLTKNIRFFDANNNLILTINKETKSTVSTNSVQSKVYDNIFRWMAEN